MIAVLKFIRAQSGGGATEYGLIAALIGIVLIGSLGLTGNTIGGMFGYIGSTVANALASF